MRVADYERETKKIEDRLEPRAHGRHAGHARPHEERGKVEKLGDRVGAARAAAVAQTTEAEVSRPPRAGARSACRRSGPGPGASANIECDQLSRDESSRQKTETDLRAEIVRRPAAGTADRRATSRKRSCMQKEIDLAIEGGAHQAAARNRRHEARGRADLGGRARRERAAARAHQRHRRRDRTAHGRARRPELADRGDPGLRSLDGAAAEGRQWRHRSRRQTSTPTATARATSPIAFARCKAARRAYRHRPEAHASSRPVASMAGRLTLVSGIPVCPRPHAAAIVSALPAFAGRKMPEIATRRATERKTFTDAEIVDGFFKVIFGAEFHVAGGVDRIRKYDDAGPGLMRQPRQARPARAGRRS